jgi:putative ABC transport system permease protein
LELGWENEANDVGSTVVGVMPPGFRFPDPDVEVWAPLLLDPDRVWREGHWFSMIGRVAAGESIETAQAEMSTIMDRWRDDYPDHHRGHFLYLTPLLDDFVADVRPALMLLLGAVGFVLLIACANVASLLLARGQQRSREIAVRRALGAGRARLLRQLLTESVVLAALGGALGVALAVFGVDALLVLEGGSLPRLDDVGVDGSVLAFAGALVVLTTVAFGLFPAGTVVRANLSKAFSDGGTRSGSSVGRLRMRRGLVISEVMLAVILVLGASLMAKSLWRTLRQDPGFEVEGVLATRITFPESRYTAQEKLGFMERLVERIGARPEVLSAGIANRPPLLFDDSWTRFSILGRPETQSAEESPTASFVMAGESLFETLGISLVRGRLFDAADDGDAPAVAIIDEIMAERYWPGEDPIGRRIELGVEGGERIVGIVTPARFDALTKQAPTLYTPGRQAAVWAPFMVGTVTLLTRSSGDPLALAGPVRDLVREFDPKLPILMMHPMSDMVGSSVAGTRFLLTLLTVFAGVALLLGGIGIYGVISQSVAQRTNEIGIRRALGAGGGQLMGMILRQGALVACVGIGLGLVAALALNRLLVSFLYEVSTTDPATYVSVAGAVGAVAVLAALLPARRASRVDPMEALRTE